MLYAIAAYYPQEHGGVGAPWGEVFGYTKTEESAADAMMARAVRIADCWAEHRKLEEIVVKYSAYVAYHPGKMPSDPRSLPICGPTEVIISGKISGEKVTIRVCVEPVEELECY